MNHDQNTIANEAIELERQFRANHRRGRISNPCPLVIKGTIHFVVSAPHAVVHYRKKEEGPEKRLNERYTGSLALQLQKRTGASAIIFARTTDEDPNWDETSVYKTTLKELVKDASLPSYFVLDLHGMDEDAKRDVVIGTANCKSLMGFNSLLAKLILALGDEGLKNIGVDEKFPAAKQHTITSYTYLELERPAMQLEIRRDWREPDSDDKNKKDKYEHLVLALCSAIKAIHTDVTEYNDRGLLK